MDGAEIVCLLADGGIRLRVEGDQLLAEPKSSLTDATRVLIRANRELIVGALRATMGLPAGFRAALLNGRLVVCQRCEHFSHRLGRTPDGYCNYLDEGVWGQLPFDCRTYRGILDQDRETADGQ